MQPALVGPTAIASCAAFLGVYSVAFRGFESQALGLAFPLGQVGPGDVGMVFGVGILLLSSLTMFARGGTHNPRTVASYATIPTWGAICQSHGTFGFSLWGAAAGVATRKFNATAFPTTALAPVATAFFISVAYHLVILGIAFLVCAAFAAPLMYLMAGIGTLSCLKGSFPCDAGADGWSAFTVSIAWMTCSAVFWLWISDLWFGVRRIVEARRTIRRIEFGAVKYRKPAAGTAPALEVLHLSDLHFVGDDLAGRAESLGREPIGNRLLEERFAELAEDLQRCDVIVFSGDLTDTGSSSEWNALKNVIERWPEQLRQKVFVVPGNHDVNVIAPANRVLRERDTDDLHGRHLRQALFARFARQLTLPGDAHATFAASGELELRPASHWFDSLLGEMASFVQATYTGDGPLTTGNAFRWTVPVSVRRLSTAAGRFALVGVDTSNWGLTAFSNALGSSHVKTHLCVIECARTLAMEGFTPIVVGHHAMIPICERGTAPSTGSKAKDAKNVIFVAGAAQLYGDAWFEGLVDSVPAPGFVYLHGHRHVTRHIGTELRPGRRGYLLGAPSLLFGDEWDGSSSKIALRHRIRLQGADSSSIAAEVNQLWVETIELHSTSS